MVASSRWKRHAGSAFTWMDARWMDASMAAPVTVRYAESYVPDGMTGQAAN